MSGAVRFDGYAAIFDREDRGGDVILPGAFADSLARLGGAPLPLLWQHDDGQPIGVVESISEDGRGLRVIGRLMPRPGVAARAAEAVRQGRIDGLSFGYRVVDAAQGPPRRLERLDIVEVSLVAHPMQPLARVHAVEGEGPLSNFA